jgi:hypothetical protein
LLDEHVLPMFSLSPRPSAAQVPTKPFVSGSSNLDQRNAARPQNLTAPGPGRFTCYSSQPLPRRTYVPWFCSARVDLALLLRSVSSRSAVHYCAPSIPGLWKNCPSGISAIVILIPSITVQLARVPCPSPTTQAEAARSHRQMKLEP